MNSAATLLLPCMLMIHAHAETNVEVIVPVPPRPSSDIPIQVQPLQPPATIKTEPRKEALKPAAPLQQAAPQIMKEQKAPQQKASKPNVQKAPEIPRQPLVQTSPVPMAPSPILSPNLLAISNEIAAIAKKVTPAVVNISTTQIIEGQQDGDIPKIPGGPSVEDFFKDFFDRQFQGPRRVMSLGSGFIIYSDGAIAYIVTNYHVIKNAKKITITLHDKTELEGEIQGTDERTDIALIKVQTTKLPPYKRRLTTVQWGDSSQVVTGYKVIAIGNPFGLGGTVTDGIVSNVDRDIRAQTAENISSYVDDFIQHSAPINKGSSGGVLLDLYGNVIGINSAIYTPTGGNVGVGFAIPSNLARDTVNQLIQFGKTRRGFIGLRVHLLSADDAEALGLGDRRGVLVGEVIAGGPSEGKIMRNDVILEFDGKAVNDHSDAKDAVKGDSKTASEKFTRIVGQTPVNKAVKVKLLRRINQQMKEIEVEIKVAEYVDKGDADIKMKKPNATPDKTAAEAKCIGITIRNLTDDLRQRYLVPKDAKGVLIVGVDAKSSAADHVEVGDVILEATQKEIKTIQEFVGIVDESRKMMRKHIMLLILRRGDQRFTTLELDETIQNQSSELKPGMIAPPKVLTPNTQKPKP